MGLLALALLGWSSIGPPTGVPLAAAPPGVPLAAITPPSSAAPPTYADPAKATTALLHGIIADAVVNHPGRGRIRSLAQLRQRVALPLPPNQLTRGMKHALATYHLDGWGRPFKISGGRYGGYRVTSAGADGELGTADDRKLRVRPSRASWELTRHAYFLRVCDGEPVVLFRSAAGHRTFRYRDRAAAQAATGSSAFDLIKLKEVPGRPRWRLTVARRKLRKQVKREPLALIVFRGH
jgi:hypothetical protein